MTCRLQSTELTKESADPAHSNKLSRHNKVQLTAKEVLSNCDIHNNRKKMKFLGHTRFSVDSYNSNNFAATRRDATHEEYLNWLYDPERLNPRLEIFCNESLPQLALASEGFDVKHVVSFSESLPEYAKQELVTSAETYEFVLLNETKTSVGANLASVTTAQNALNWQPGTNMRFGVYRLDDDDLLPIDYFQRLAPYLESGMVGWRVSFASGFTALRSRGEYYFARENYQAMASVGLFAIAQFSQDGEIEGARDYSHTKTDRYQPVILDSREAGFFRSRHRTQDNTIGTHSTAYPVETFQQLRRYAPADLEDVERKFPVLRNLVHRTPESTNSRVDVFTKPVEITEAPVPFFIPYESGATLHIRVNESTRIISGSIIIRLHLKDSDGTIPDPSKFKTPLSQLNIRYSSEHGFYTQVWHGEPGPDYHVLVKLPDRLRLLGGELIAGRTSNIQLEYLGVYRLPDDDASNKAAKSQPR